MLSSYLFRTIVGVRQECLLSPTHPSSSTYFWKDSAHLIQKPCYKRGSLCQDPAGNGTTQRPPDHRKATQTEVVWSCLPFIRSGQNHLARHNDWGKKTRQTEEEAGRQHQGMGRPVFRQVPESSGEQGKWRNLVMKPSVVPRRPWQLSDG